MISRLKSFTTRKDVSIRITPFMGLMRDFGLALIDEMFVIDMLVNNHYSMMRTKGIHCKGFVAFVT